MVCDLGHMNEDISRSRMRFWFQAAAQDPLDVAVRIDGLEVRSNPPELRRSLNRAQAEAEGWFNGPPYAVAEHVFDENDQQGCSLGHDE